MAHFPMFVDLTDRRVLIVGSGPHVSEKAEKMALFDCRLDFCTTEECAPEHLTADTAMVILADRHHPRNPELVRLCHGHRIPVNAVDDPPLCDFQFPSLIRRGELTVAFSTSGKAPAVGRFLREEMESLLPNRTEDILQWSAELTRELRVTVPEYHRRGELLNRMLRRAFALNRPLTPEEVSEFF